MKKHLFLRGLFFLGMILLLPAIPLLQKSASVAPAFVPTAFPTFPFSFERTNRENFASSMLPLAHPTDSQQPPPPIEKSNLVLPSVYKILDKSSGNIFELSPTEYIIGVVAAEMPASFELEALKAQAVAAHSYALRQMGNQFKAPSPELKGAYLSTDPAHFQAYLSESEQKKRLGKNFEAWHKKLSQAVTAVISNIIVYEDEPIAAAFHSISSGKTESAETVWGKAVPYLVPVDSAEDLSNQKCKTSTLFTKKEVLAILSDHLGAENLPKNSTVPIKIFSRSDSGTVLEAQIGSVRVSGTDLREWFSLPSANFTIRADESTLSFFSLGYGHGVGMSQYGANAMAKSGKTVWDILRHYYPGTEIISVSTSHS